eukprot:1068828-Ditylum_brightwellii.AAC.1
MAQDHPAAWHNNIRWDKTPPSYHLRLPRKATEPNSNTGLVGVTMPRHSSIETMDQNNKMLCSTRRTLKTPTGNWIHQHKEWYAYLERTITSRQQKWTKHKIIQQTWLYMKSTAK